MDSASSPGKRLVVFKNPRTHSRAPRISQRLMLEDEILAKEIRELTHQRKKLRERIHQALAQGAKCEPGFRSAAIITRHILRVR